MTGRTKTTRLNEARRPLRAALYARYSTELQSDRSIDDQFALCQTYAERENLTVVETYSDRARTSASLKDRKGLEALMADAKAGRIDVVVVEALDRISRDQADLANVHKYLEFWQVEIQTVGSGRADVLQIGFAGLMGQISLQDHKRKVRRALAGVVREGRSAGGRSYGYRPKLGYPGELEVQDDEAAVVRRIYEMYVEGASPREIAGRLNAEGVPPPRSTRWNASTINGQPERGCGILLNPLYGGTLIWNRLTMVRDPDTGRRVSRVNPESEWQRVPVPHLAIVPSELFEAARHRKEARRLTKETGQVGRALARPQRPFSGLLRCGCCGGGMAISKKRKGSVWGRCSTRRESGSCGNTREVRIDRIEAAVFEGLKSELANPVYVRAFLKSYQEERRTARAASRRDRATLEKAAARARSAFERAQKLYIDGITDGPEAEATIRHLLNQARAAEQALAEAGAEESVVEVHPAAIDRYLSALDDLGAHLATGEAPQAVEVLRELVNRIVVTPDGPVLRVEVEGHLASLLNDVPPICRGTYVAEEGLEPPTRGL